MLSIVYSDLKYRMKLHSKEQEYREMMKAAQELIAPALFPGLTIH